MTSSGVNFATMDRFVGYHMKRAVNVVQADLDRTLKQFDLRLLTHSALVLIADNPGLRQTQLAAAMSLGRSNVVVIVDALEARHMVVRRPVPSDRRAYALTATMEGQRVCKLAVAAVQAHEARLFAGLDMRKRDVLVKSLSSLHISKEI